MVHPTVKQEECCLLYGIFSEIVTVLSKGRKQECKNEKRNLIKVNQAWF